MIRREEMESFINNGFGWCLEMIQFIGVYSLKFKSFEGASYMELPPKAILKKTTTMLSVVYY